jgi:hypothetical protein
MFFSLSIYNLHTFKLSHFFTLSNLVALQPEI